MKFRKHKAKIPTWVGTDGVYVALITLDSDGAYRTWTTEPIRYRDGAYDSLKEAKDSFNRFGKNTNG